MFFTFSKLLIYFIFPISWIIVLLVFACFTKHKKYRHSSIIAAVTLLFLFSNPFLLNQFAKQWDVQTTTLKKLNYSCALILGGYISEDNTGHGFLNAAADRYIQGIKLKENKTVSHLLFTGGSANLVPDKFNFTEGNWIKTEVRNFNIADSCLLFEKKSRNTIENIQFSKAILEAKRLPPPYLLVTSAFHMRRALLICKKANLNVVPYPCNFFAGKGIFTFADFIPSAQTLSDWNVYIKELIGYVVTSLKS